MDGRIEVVQGDMFDGPSDLVVIPCSTVPTVTSFVSQRLEAFNLPKPTDPMGLGEVRYQELHGLSHIAQMAAYAASVHRYESGLAALEAIGESLGSFAVTNEWARQIASKMLGSGAGGLDPVAATLALSRGYLGKAPERSLLRVFVIDVGAYDRIRAKVVSELEAGRETPVRLVRSTAAGLHQLHAV